MPIFYSDQLNTNEDNTLTSGSITLGTPEELSGADYLYIRGKFDGYIPRLTGTTITETGVIDGFDGYKYVLRAISLSGTNMSIGFTGSDIEVDKLYVMKKLFEFDDDDTFIRQDMGRIERGAIVHEDLYYNNSKVRGYPKRSIAYTAEYQEFRKAREFEVFRDDNEHFLFSEFDLTSRTELEDGTEPLTFHLMPERLYKAMLEREVTTRYSTPNRGDGLDIDFEIRER